MRGLETRRLVERGVTRTAIRRALAVGEVTVSREHDGVRHARLWTKRGVLVVHFIEGQTGIYVITTYFDD
jgi:hypothetical protein